jgi:hypothetical protein
MLGAFLGGLVGGFIGAATVALFGLSPLKKLLSEISELADRFK